MMRSALRMLLGDRLKYAEQVAGLAFASLLITQQASILAGFTARAGSWIRDTSQADLWVLDPEVQFTEDKKPMLETELLRVRGIDGVASWACSTPNAPRWRPRSSGGRASATWPPPR